MERIYYKTSGLKKSPPVQFIDKYFANKMLDDWHYLGGKTRGVLHAIGHDEGCLIFGNCTSRYFQKRYRDRDKKVIELIRMVGVPEHKWAMSSLMSQSIKLLKTLDLYDVVVTYSDPLAGHGGMVYSASG